jgi:hypothetical protein
MTGWAQIHGRNALAWEERLALDVWYVDHWSFGLDLRILARTPWIVASRRGVSPPGRATMPEFLGTSQVAGAGPASAFPASAGDTSVSVNVPHPSRTTPVARSA